jgi:hypothetical protein
MRASLNAHHLPQASLRVYNEMLGYHLFLTQNLAPPSTFSPTRFMVGSRSGGRGCLSRRGWGRGRVAGSPSPERSPPPKEGGDWRRQTDQHGCSSVSTKIVRLEACNVYFLLFFLRSEKNKSQQWNINEILQFIYICFFNVFLVILIGITGVQPLLKLENMCQRSYTSLSGAYLILLLVKRNYLIMLQVYSSLHLPNGRPRNRQVRWERTRIPPSPSQDSVKQAHASGASAVTAVSRGIYQFTVAVSTTNLSLSASQVGWSGGSAKQWHLLRTRAVYIITSIIHGSADRQPASQATRMWTLSRARGARGTRLWAAVSTRFRATNTCGVYSTATPAVIDLSAICFPPCRKPAPTIYTSALSVKQFYEREWCFRIWEHMTGRRFGAYDHQCFPISEIFENCIFMFQKNTKIIPWIHTYVMCTRAKFR